MIDLRLGDWTDDYTEIPRVDAVITDPPYSARTHGADFKGETDSGHRQWVGESYEHLDPRDVTDLVSDLERICDGWICAMTDHSLAPAFEAAYKKAGRYAFAPVPIIERGRNVRLAGDGPACWGLWLMVSRPRVPPYSKWGALPGGYVVGREEKLVPGGKGLGLMRAIIRDYTRPGDLILDPYAGGGTTLLAAAMEGRRAIGYEVDPATHGIASARLARGYTRDLFAAAPAPSQGSLL